MSESISELYVEEIKANLKEDHASVLVGAGFSRNAIRIDGSAEHMPDWSALADIFCEKLGIDPKDQDNRYADPLALAQQVVELYGRPYMDKLLRDSIDDDAYAPGVVHDLLISLPWTDIFTTNYDTLLERSYQANINGNLRKIFPKYTNACSNSKGKQSYDR